MDWYSEGAPRNLSADQFISVKNLTRMPSIDYPHRPTLDVGDKLFDLQSPVYRGKPVDMLSRHIQNQTIDPVHVNHPQELAKEYAGDNSRFASSDSPLGLGNGGHRVALSTQFKNVHRLPVTPNRGTSHKNYQAMLPSEHKKNRLGRMLDKQYPAPSVSLGTALKRDYSVKKIRGATI